MGPRATPLFKSVSLMGALAIAGVAAGPAPARAGSGGAAGATSASSSCGCAPTTHLVIVPGVSITPPQINIGLPSIGVGVGQASASGVGAASASAENATNVSVTTSGSGSSSTSTTSQNAAALLSSGGGSGSWSAEGGVTTEIQDIKVESPLPPPAVAPPICAAWRTGVRQVAVQASCLDDKAVPHPASQVSPDRAVAPGYEGEVFRCIAGSRMQYTVAEFSGQVDFNHGQTFVCEKGEALYHSATGALQCRPQAPARDCNERSLLRRFGAGIKVLALSAAPVCAAWRSQTVVSAAPPATGPQVLN
jgi:hypothetical protein